MGKSNKRYTLHTMLFVFAAMLVSCFVNAMDEPTGKGTLVYVVTSDGQQKAVERWKIDQMKTLLVLLEQQRGSNSQANPIQSSMLTILELDLLNDSLDAISRGTFKQFYTKIFDRDAELLQKGQTVLSLDQGSLRTLIKAAEKAEARAVSAFCLSYVMPLDMQKSALVPYLIQPIIDIIPLKPLWVLNKHSSFVSDVVFSPNSRYVLACGLDEQRDKDLLLWDVEEGTYTFLPNAGCSLSAIWSSDGKYIVMTGAGNQDNLCVFDMATKQSRILMGHPFIGSVAFSPKGEFFVTGSLIDDQDNVIVWNVVTGEPQVFMRHPGQVKAVAWSPDGKYIVAVGDGDQNNVIVWDVKTEKQQISMQHSLVKAVAWSPDSAYIVSGGGGQNNLIVWDAKTGKQQISMEHPGVINAIAWSSDGRYIVSGGGKDLIVWNAITGEQLKIGKGHSSFISSVAFSPDGQYLVSGCLGPQNNLILWSLLSKQEKEAFANCTFAQAQLLYQLILGSIQERREQLESPDVRVIFDSLPQVIKDILQEGFHISPAKQVEASASVEMEATIECPPGKQGSCIIF